MPELIAIVSDAAEALQAAGADRVVLRIADAIRLEGPVASASPLSLLLGDHPSSTGDLAGVAQRCGCDEIRAPLAAIPALALQLPPPLRFIGIVAVGEAEAVTLDRLAIDRLAGLMLVGDQPMHLLESPADTARVAAAITLFHKAGLTVSLGGGLEPPDVARLLPLHPDAFCFGSELRRDGRLDPARLRATKDLMAGAWPQAPVVAEASPLMPDRIFVTDWVLPIRIGAYNHERDAPQRVRFGVEAAVARVARKAAELGDVVSYDLITDSIRRLTVEHVDLVETLAERIAEAVLSHPRVLQVTVTVEKLDLGPGALGCRITRDKAG